MSVGSNVQSSSTERQREPLFSDQIIRKITLWVTLIAIATVGLNLFGHWYSAHMMQGTNTDDTTPVDIFIGPDHLRLPVNVIRFPEQRVTGETESINLYLLWPDMVGYSDAKRAFFNRVSGEQRLIMVEISQATMTLDMSGRLEPIYSRLFDGPSEPGPHGLNLHHLKSSSGYGDEVLLTGETSQTSPFVIRCLLPKSRGDATGADCQRDIAAGTDLSVLYRYSSTMLGNWTEIDAAINDYIADHIVTDSSARTQRLSH